MGQTETVSDYATSRNNAWNAYCVYMRTCFCYLYGITSHSAVMRLMCPALMTAGYFFC